MTDPRHLLDKYGLRAKKSWGQNFLVDERAHAAIVRAAGLGPGDWVVEIGAGLGTLTEQLAREATRVLAIERDRDLAAVLRAELPAVDVREENALTFDYAAAAAEAGRPVVVVGNLPYQIASPLLFSLLDSRPSWRRAVVMLQKEMADRILASPGTKAYGALGVMITTYAEARLVLRVRAGAFHPRPQVDSAVLALDPLPAPRAPIESPGTYSATVHAAFGQRRKTLRNALRSRWDAAAVERALEQAGIDGQRRGETLSVAEFARLAGALPHA